MQGLHAEGNVLDHTIDEKRRCGTDVAAPPACGVLANPLKIDMVVDLGRIARQIKTELARVAPQIRILEMQLSSEQQIVHVPEFSLRGRYFGRLRRQQRMRVRILQREMAKYERNPIR